jgi:hypothetical protein
MPGSGVLGAPAFAAELAGGAELAVQLLQALFGPARENKSVCQCLAVTGPPLRRPALDAWSGSTMRRARETPSRSNPGSRVVKLGRNLLPSVFAPELRLSGLRGRNRIGVRKVVLDR